LATAERISFWDDEGGATFLEFTVGMMTFFVILFGIIEFSYIFYQWNAATKAVQFGARLAAVSEPVASDLTTMTGVGGGVLPGGQMPTFDFECTATTGDGSAGTCTPSGTYSPSAMQAIVFGRLNDSVGTARTTCSTAAVSNPLQNGMCNYFSGITSAQMVKVRYQYTGLGYAGRPGGPGHTGGPVPTITVSVTGITYSFTFLNGLMGFSTATVPGLATTVTGEDLNAAGS
jgi:Flp pilus assembly protein TadG